MARVWIIDGKSIAKRVRNAAVSSDEKDHSWSLECPRCRFRVDNSDVGMEFPELPAGVKFDPSDVELLDHLAAKCGSLKPNPFIDVFIHTLQDGNGLCYTHPENLPGAKKNGSTFHFFHKTTNAYSTGNRKRRKVEIKGTVLVARWHKTGKTKAILDEHGVHKGFKKIMVLRQYGNGFAESKWVAHQYHLGTNDEEDDDQYVLSKVFYQNRNALGHKKRKSCCSADEVKEEVIELDDHVDVFHEHAKLDNFQFDFLPELGEFQFDWIDKL